MINALLENEVKLDSFTESVLLTNYRIMQENGNEHKTSIFLEKISSIEMCRKGKGSKVFFLFGIFFIISWLILLAFIIIIPEIDAIEYLIYSEYGIWPSTYTKLISSALGFFGITAPLFFGLALIIAFFLTRERIIIISPDIGKNLNIEVSRKMSGESIEEFLTKIQNAKLNRRIL